MLPTWEPGLTIERKDVSGNYEPSNCEWTTQQRQVRNKESTIKVEIDGTLVPITDLADRYGINRHTLWQRWRNGKRGADLIAPVR